MLEFKKVSPTLIRIRSSLARISQLSPIFICTTTDPGKHSKPHTYTGEDKNWLFEGKAPKTSNVKCAVGKETGDRDPQKRTCQFAGS